MDYSHSFPTKTNQRKVSTGSEAQWTQPTEDVLHNRTESVGHCHPESDVLIVLSEAEPRRSGRKNRKSYGRRTSHADANLEISNPGIKPTVNKNDADKPGSSPDVLKTMIHSGAEVEERLNGNQLERTNKAAEPISFTVIRTDSNVI